MEALLDYEFIIDESSNEQFEINESIEIAKDNIESYIDGFDISYFKYFSYDDNVWFVYNVSGDMFHKIDFTQYENNKSRILFKVLKCWVASLLLDYSGGTIAAHFNRLDKVLNVTDIFSESKQSDLEEYLLSDITVPVKNETIASILNFLDFYDDFNSTDDYIQLVGELRERYNVTPRAIPSNRDCMMFIFVLNNFYSSVSTSDPRYLYYYPLRIWWIITTKIPMRIGEFLKIKREKLTIKDDKYYLILPRSKEKNNKRRVQVIDEIEITQELYNIINHYIEETSKYGESKTLISYKAHRKLRAIIWGYNEQNKRKKRNEKTINSDSFRKLLNDFYDLIIKRPPYNLSVRDIGVDDLETISSARNVGVKYDIERRLRANDTRHLAFMFLKLQGLHPVEIARLGGHTTLGAQNHYFRHREFETDSSTIQLLRLFDVEGKYFKSKFFNTIKEPIINSKIDDEFRRRFILKIQEPDEGKWDKLEKGWCTAKTKRCQSPCFQCDFWKITYEEFQEKYNEIVKWINTTENKAVKIYNALGHLHEEILSSKTEEYELDIQLKQTLNTKSKKLRSLLESIGVFYENIEEQTGVNLEWETGILQKKSSNYLTDL